MKLLLRDLVTAAGGQLISGVPFDKFEHLSIDTRTLEPGDVFFALVGPRFDGHDYLRMAGDKGACAVVIQKLDGRADFDPRRHPAIVQVPDTLKALQDLARYVRERVHTTVIGITGSNGKTTTKEMLAAILKRRGRTLATRGNLNNHIGLPLMVCEMDDDTRYAVIEMGTSKKGDMALLVEIARPYAGLITNVGKDHLQYLGTPEGVLEENRRLYDALPKSGVAIINMDDPLLRPLSNTLPCRTVTFGHSAGASVWIDQVQPWPLPVRFTLHFDSKEYAVTLSTPGSIHTLNALAAAATAHAMGISPEDIVAGLRAFQPVAMRMQIHQRPDGTVLVNDAYNANPSSVRVSVSSFCESFPDRHRWLVLGDMRELGPTARAEHEELGRWLATQPLERVYLYGRDTRFVEAGLRAAGASISVERFRKKRYLIEALQRSLTPVQPAVLFKASRGIQLEQVIAPLIVGAAGSMAAAH